MSINYVISKSSSLARERVECEERETSLFSLSLSRERELALYSRVKTDRKLLGSSYPVLGSNQQALRSTFDHLPVLFNLKKPATSVTQIKLKANAQIVKNCALIASEHAARLNLIYMECG
eukprot:scaffold155264_cov49-Attheya_sp.AAC.1